MHQLRISCKECRGIDPQRDSEFRQKGVINLSSPSQTTVGLDSLARGFSTCYVTRRLVRKKTVDTYRG
jgi:hypothetical protein